MGDKVPDKTLVKLANNNTPTALVKLGISGASEVHRLILEDRDQLLRRKEEITQDIANLTCSQNVSGMVEVSQALVDCPSLTLAFMIFFSSV